MRNASSSRREPRNHLKGFFRTRGITAVELLVFLAAIIIVSSLAFPSFRAPGEREQFVQQAEDLAAFLGQARMESVMRGQAMTVSYHYSGVDRWCVGQVEGVERCDCRIADPSIPGACRVDSASRVFSNLDRGRAGIIDQLIGDGAFTFNPAQGALLDSEDMAELVLLSDTGRYSLSIHVESTGSVRVCSEHSGTRVPGFRLC